MSEMKPTKFCPDCKQEVDKANFHKNRQVRSGLNTYCKPCTLKRNIPHVKARKQRDQIKKELQDGQREEVTDSSSDQSGS